MSEPLRNPSDFAAIFDEHATFVWRVLRRHGVREAELADACQEVFLVLHRRLAEFEGRSSLRTWLYGISARVAFAARRRNGRRRESLTGAVPERVSDADPARQAEQGQLLDRLGAALAELGEKKREVFVLYELEDMSIAEVAQALGVPENTALSRLYAARSEVRRVLDPPGAATSEGLALARRRAR